MGTKGAFAFLLGLAAILGVARSDFSLAGLGKKKKAQITFWNGFTGPDGRVMLQLVRDFNQANPDVEVTMQRMEWGTYYNKLLVAELDGRGPDVFVVQSMTLPRMQRAGFIAPVTELFDTPGGVPSADFDKMVIDQVRYGKDMVGVPLDIWPYGLYSNGDLLKQAGIVDPQGNPRPPRNRVEFIAAAKAMRHTPNGESHPDIWGYALTDWKLNFETLLPQFDGRYFDENGKPDLANPNNVEALQFFANLGGKDALTPPPENAMGWVGYRQKKVGMVMDGIYMLGDLLRLNDFQYIASPVPVIGHHAGTLAGSHILCVRGTASPDQKAAGERFIEYLSAHSLAWAGAGQVPARKSVRDTEDFKKLPVQSAFASQIPTMQYLPRTPVIFEMDLELNLAVEKVIRGRASAKAALTEANEHVQKALDNDADAQVSKP